MKCLLCNAADTLPGATSVQLERGHLSLTINNVPARICPHCGETYADELVVVNLLLQAEELARAGVKMDVREYTQMVIG